MKISERIQLALENKLLKLPSLSRKVYIVTFEKQEYLILRRGTLVSDKYKIRVFTELK